MHRGAYGELATKLVSHRPLSVTGVVRGLTWHMKLAIDVRAVEKGLLKSQTISQNGSAGMISMHSFDALSLATGFGMKKRSRNDSLNVS